MNDRGFEPGKKHRFHFSIVRRPSQDACHDYIDYLDQNAALISRPILTGPASRGSIGVRRFLSDVALVRQRKFGSDFG
ncbi:hypothetical protein AU14_16515 [Marinobacter similis]|uniref:Uncharacterized protein n=1 Tax=Marinobacter similis TaxID=1420916 RepID=W5YLY8_9GAMM|nr:hypothetical protein AU14_16515 [Marinobacter similis]